MEQGVKDVQENQTTVEKYEKIFKKSSETKSRRDEESIRKCGTIRDRRVTTWRTCVGRVTTWRNVCKVCQVCATDNSGKV